MSSSDGDEAGHARFRAPAAEVRRNRVLGPATAAMAALAPISVMIASLAHLPWLAMLSPILLLLGVGGSYFAFAENPWTTEMEGEIEAGREGLSVNGRLRVAREEIRAGFVLPDAPRRPRVRIQRKRRLPVEIRVRDEAEGRALLRALGLDATQRAATFSTPSRVLSDNVWSIAFGFGFAGLFVVIAILQAGLGRHSTFQLPILAVYLAFMFLTRTKITVGADGILRSWIGTKEFWSYADIESVTQYDDRSFWRRQKWQGVELVLRSGASVRLPVSSQQWRNQSSLDLITQRIHEAMDSHRQGDPAAETALLSRHARPVADWIQSLRAIGSGAHLDHRTAPVAPERLFRIVEDASAGPSARAGAAVALGATLDAGGKERLRGAAGAIAAPKLRIAIEAAAEGDDAALIEALAAIEAEQEKRARA